MNGRTPVHYLKIANSFVVYALLVASVPLASPLPKTLTSAAQVRSLTPELAESNLPVRVRGVVTSNLGSQTGPFYFQDSSAGIFIEFLNHANLPLEPGQIVEIEGVTIMGLFAPNIRARKLKVLGKGALPVPQNSRWDAMSTGQQAAQWVEVAGIVQVAKAVKGNRIEFVI